MRKLVLVLLFLSVLLLAEKAGATVISPDNPNIQYMGRWNFDNPAAPWSVWKGTSFTVRFDGTAVTADVDAGNYIEQYRVIIDGVPSDTTVSFPKRRGTVTLASGLSSGVHTMTVMKETFVAYRTSLSVLYGLDITGTIMSPPARPSRRIEWFGDSNMDGTSLYSEQDQGDHGSYYAYPAVTSRMLGAEFHDESVAGAMIDGNGDNSVRSFIFSEDYFSQDTSYRSGLDPDVIVVNAGANDLYSVDKNGIKQRYKDMIADLRMVYGSTPHIVLFNAYGWDTDEPAIYTHEVVSEVGGNLSCLVYPWMWAQYHGSMIEHAGQANLLADHILSLGLGFSKVQDSEVFDSFGRNFGVANGSFEESGKAGFDAFGWRYYDDTGVSRIYDPADAADGDYFVRLETNDPDGNWGSIQQGTDATGDFMYGATTATQYYDVSLMLRGAAGTQAEVIAFYQTQQMYDYTGTPDVQTVNITSTNWQQYNVTVSAPAGIWLTYIKVRAASGTIDVDAISMSEGGGGSYCGDGTCDPGEDSCNCSSDCGAPPAEICDNGSDEDCDGYTDCDDIDCSSDPACLGSYCGDGTCDPGEDQCNCSDDCGAPPSSETNCTDGIDEDCDGGEDCNDPTGDCDTDPACQPACDNDGICDPGEDCSNCSNDCDGVQTGKPSDRYCCGNGIAESSEGDGSICDGNY